MANYIKSMKTAIAFKMKFATMFSEKEIITQFIKNDRLYKKKSGHLFYLRSIILPIETLVIR